jgi:hypothetical protein
MALPTSAEPLRLADGTLIAPSGRVVKKSVSPSEMIEVPSNTIAQRMVAASRRKLADLPALPQQMNVISVVLMYTMFGVNDDEIAIATGMSVEQVTSLKGHDVYSRVQEEVAKNIIVQDQSEIRTLVAANARKAANRIADLIISDDDDIALRAAKDTLDRSGFRPADVVEHRHSVSGGLVIEVIKRDDSVKLPTINLEYGDLNGNRP